MTLPSLHLASTLEADARALLAERRTVAALACTARAMTERRAVARGTTTSAAKGREEAP